MKSILLMFLWMLCSLNVFSQSLSTIGTSTVTGIQVCQNATFSFQVQRNSGNYATTDTVQITLQLPNGIAFQSGTLTGTGTASADATNPQAPIITVTGLTGNTFSYAYQINAGCELFNANTSQSLTHQYAVVYNGTNDHSFTTNSYNVVSPWLVFDGVSSTNLNYGLGQFNVSYQRTFKYVNTSPVPFTGNFNFLDTVQLDQSLAGVSFADIEVTYPIGAELTRVVTDSSVFVKANVVNLASGDSIIVTETVYLISCPSGFDNSVTWFQADYGCTGGALCQTITDQTSYTTAAFDPNDKPQLQYRIFNTDYECPANDDWRVYRFVNTGQGAASSLNVQMYKAPGNNISYFDTTTLELYKIVGGVEVPITRSVYLVSMNTNSASPNHPQYYRFNSDEPIPAGDTIYLRFPEKKVCIDTADYGNYFNSETYMNQVTVLVRFDHPCFNTGFQNTDNSKSVWGPFDQVIGLTQNFENYTGSMEINEERWFEINNQSPLKANSPHPYFPYEMGFDITQAQFQVTVSLEAGLGLVDDSLMICSFQNTTDSIWNPSSISYISGNSLAPGQGDKIIATFDFPAEFQDPGNGNPHFNYGALWEKSAYYNSFFSSFRVKFKLRSYCEYLPPSKSTATITEQTFLVYDKNCAPECKIPLSSVSDLINIHCPGCILPGWNLNAFDLQRKNFGGQDDNNNNYPDSYPNLPANPNLAKIKRVMLGDTIECFIAAHTSDGEDLLFNDIGFDYTAGQFLIKSTLLSSLDFVGATGSYKRFDGAIETFTIPASAGVFEPTGFTIDIGVQALESYGMTPGFLSRFWIYENITIEPQFRVTQNLNAGIGGDPYFSTESMNAWINMSGTPFTGIDIKPDANLDVPALIAMTPAERSEKMYWCTGWEGRITGIGADFTYGNTIVENYNGIWGVTGLDPCLSKIKTRISTDVGQAYSGAQYGYDDGNQSALNAFSFEIRNLWMLDSMSWVIPADWEVARVEFRVSPIKTVNNVSSYTCGNYDWIAPYVYPDSAIVYQDSTVTVHPALYYQELMSFPSNCGSNDLVAYDETKRYSINLLLKMKDCNTRDIIDLSGGYPVTTHWSNFPGSLSGDTTIVRPMVNTILDKPTAELELQVLASNQNTLSGNDLSWDINIQTQAGSVYDVANRGASNAFFYFEAPSGNLNVTDMNWISNGTTINPIDTINGNTLWALGRIGDTYSFGGRIGGIRVNAEYDCSQVNGTDSVLLIYGWNCYEYPTALDAACYLDTMVLYIQPKTPGLQGLLTVDDVVNACDTLHYELELKATGIGVVEDVEVRLDLPGTGQLAYMAGSGMLNFNGNMLALEPSSDSLGLFWNLDSANFMSNAFNGLSPSAYLSFDVVTSCGFSDQVVALDISATNYCGKIIGDFTLERSPAVVLGLPELDSLSLNLTATSGLPCGDTTWIQLDVLNAGNQSTGAFNTVTIQVPSGFVYAGGSPYTSSNGNALTFDLTANTAVGATETINFYVLNTSTFACGSHPVSASLTLGATYYCDTVLCSIETVDEAATATTDIIIVDTEAPIITGVPANISISCTDTITTPIVSFTDNCGASMSYDESTQNGTCPSNYTVTKTWTAVDLCGNTSIQTQVISVSDNEAPVIDCPSDMTLASGASTATWTLSATDDCGLATVVSDIPSGSVFNVGTTTVTITATDLCGNSSTCTFNVTRVPPIEVDAGPCATVYLGYGPTECTTLSASIIIGSNGPYSYVWSNGATGSTTTVCPTETTTYTVTVTDGNGFTASATVLVNVIDARCGNNGKKVVVCHVPPGNPGNAHEICIAPQAVGAHVDGSYGHSGCHVGPCDMVNPCDVESRLMTEFTEDNSDINVIESIYPNPNTGLFTVLLSEDVILTETRIDVYDVLGKLVYTTNPQDLLVDIDLTKAHVKAAVYMVHVHSGTQLRVEKVIVQ